MIIFLILEHAIAKWYSYQPSIIISNPSPSVIHHHHHIKYHLIIHPSSSHHHHHIGSSFIGSSFITSSHIRIIIESSIIITYRSSSAIHHHHISIIFIHPSSSNIREIYFVVGCWDFPVRESCWWIWILVIWARIWGRPELAFHISLITIHDAQ